MLRACDRAVVACFPCADGNPLANLTAELPDRQIYVGVSFRRIPNPPPNNFNRDTCVGFCEADSQIEADDCAARAAFDCATNHEPPPNPENPTWPTPRECNEERTCENDGLCYTIPACTVIHFTALEANAIAQSLCEFRVHDLNLATPCGSGGVPGGGGGGEVPTGTTVTYEKAWNEPARGGWTESDPCPWPDDYASVWQEPAQCLCNIDNQDPYQWPFGEGSMVDPDSMVIQSGVTLDAVLDCFVLPDTPDYENRSSVERLYLRSRIEGGATGKHVIMTADWTKPGGAWTERNWNPDTFQFDDLPKESTVKLGLHEDPCFLFNFLAQGFQVDLISNSAASGQVVYEFDVPAGAIYYACVFFESITHSNGPSTLHLVTTIT